MLRPSNLQAASRKPGLLPKRTKATRARAHHRVLDWFAANKRAFPWRDTRDPYRTLVAEVMLQQTQTSRVVPAYHRFLEAFPSVDALAAAPVADVIRAWQGLGYNRRAVQLHRAAKAIAALAEFPKSIAGLLTLPGVGDYTSAAVACFAFNQQIAVIDVNVSRVLARVTSGCSELNKKDQASIALEWLPPKSAYEWNQALMDIGATLCRAQHTLCSACPLENVCAFRARPQPRKARASKEPFEGSVRQLRGRILNALRIAEQGVPLGALSKDLDPNTVRDAVLAMEKQGLVEMRESWVSLPHEPAEPGHGGKRTKAATADRGLQG